LLAAISMSGSMGSVSVTSLNTAPLAIVPPIADPPSRPEMGLEGEEKLQKKYHDWLNKVVYQQPAER
jgi:hypothetical protein